MINNIFYFVLQIKGIFRNRAKNNLLQNNSILLVQSQTVVLLIGLPTLRGLQIPKSSEMLYIYLF
jgi:hypothetical protein